MITGWLVKIVVVVAVLGIAAVEAGSPLITRAQLDGVAHDAADSASLELMQTNDADQARAAAELIAADKDAALTAFAVGAQGEVRLTVERQARSFLLKRWSVTESWYDVEVSATAQRRGA